MDEKEDSQELKQQLMTLNSSTREMSQHVLQLDCEKQASNTELTKTICKHDSIKKLLADLHINDKKIGGYDINTMLSDQICQD